MPDTPKIHVRYVGDGKQYFIGVPARDLTKEEYDRLDPASRRDVDASDLYEKAGAKKSSANSGDDKSESENN
jgi:hypothetical protein